MMDGDVLERIRTELRQHAPFTVFGALTGIAVTVILASATVPTSFSRAMFWGLHPLHVLLSALVTTGVFRRSSAGRVWSTVAVGYVGSIGVATVSDSLIPFLGEWMLGMPNRGMHIGFIEKWWLVR